MMSDPVSVLPPNATLLERAIDRAAARRVEGIPVPLDPLWDPETCPLELLPWLAWALAVPRWDANWSEARKRAAIAESIPARRIKGTAAAVDDVLASFDDLVHLVEWWQAGGPTIPHTFDVVLPLGEANGEDGGDRATAAFAEAIVRDVSRAKPARSHFTMIQSLSSAGDLGTIGAAQVMGFQRESPTAIVDASPLWATYLQTEDGEPFEAEEDDDGDFLEETGL